MSPVPRPLMLFDLDGTLLDHDAAELAAITGWIHDAAFPREVGGAASEEIWRQVSAAAYQDYFSGRTTFAQQRRIRVRRFLPQMGLDVTGMSDQDLDTQFQEYSHRYQQALRPFPDVIGCLARLASTHRVAVLTNGDQAKQDDKMKRTGLAPLVEATIASSTLGIAKPDPAAFRAALGRLGAPIERAVYVGDRLDIDAQAATAAGLTGIWLNRKRDRTDPGDTRTIRTLVSLP
jgi:putative hydrolase of the HAD superfamily